MREKERRRESRRREEEESQELREARGQDNERANTRDKEGGRL